MLYPPLAVNDETMKVGCKMSLSSIEINSRNTMHPRDRGSCLNSVYHMGILENLYIPVHWYWDVDWLVIHKSWLSFYLWNVKPLHKVSTKTSLVLEVNLLIKKKIKIHSFTLYARSLLMKLNRIQSLLSRDSLFSITDKYLKQKHTCST